MFETIVFRKIELTDPVTDKNIEQLLINKTLPIINELSPTELSLVMLPTKQSCFQLSGTCNFFPLFPINDFTLENYNYIQTFSLLKMNSNYYTKRTNVDSYMILFTYEGSGCLEYDGITYKLNKSDGVWINCKKPHAYYTQGSNWEHSILHINGSQVALLYDEYIKKGDPCFSESTSGMYQQMLEKLLTACSISTPFRDFQVNSLLCSMITHLITESYSEKYNETFRTSTIQYLIRYIENHFTENLSLDFLSSYSGISKYHMSREFRKYTGFSPNEYIIQMRLNRAQFLLINTDYPINKIAASIGILNDQHFSKLFKKNIGMTPGKFRQIKK